ncbi:Uncharacterized protein HZ326_2969 [Fusarium oxysporum f. sp. albedinis]|nr:Uncharacterized protein HZ326_2969 [Fusarium oxysporum f. sp. albedinis]
MAKHGKKKDASSKMKNKAKPSKVKNAPLTSNTDAASKPPKSRRSSKVPANIVSKTPSSVPKARADELKRPQEAQGPPKPAPQNEVQGRSNLDHFPPSRVTNLLGSPAGVEVEVFQIPKPRNSLQSFPKLLIMVAPLLLLFRRKRPGYREEPQCLRASLRRGIRYPHLTLGGSLESAVLPLPLQLARIHQHKHIKHLEPRPKSRICHSNRLMHLIRSLQIQYLQPNLLCLR